MKATTRKMSSKNAIKIAMPKVGIFKRGTYGSTTDYDLFKPILDNRGIEGGIDEERVLKHMNDMDSGEYLDMGWDILINDMGQLGDGSHRLEARKRLGQPVRYYVTTSDSLNSRKEKERFIAISYLNSHNSQWTKKGTYKSSLKKNLKLAVAIKHLIDEVSSKTKLATNKIQVSWIFSIIKEDVKYFNNSKELNTAKVYDDSTLFKYTKTNEFRNDFEIFVELVSIFNLKFTRFNNITKYILQEHWTNSKFDINHMINNLNKYNFSLRDKFNAKDIKAEIERVYNSKRGHKSYQKLF